MFEAGSSRRRARLWMVCWTVGVSAACATPRHEERYRTLHAQLYDNNSEQSQAARSQSTLGSEAELSRSALLREVLVRNPSLESARQAWRAALARYPQETALADPMLDYSFAPLSIGSRQVPFGQTIELRQTLPFPGKREAMGHGALAEAEVMHADYELMRAELALQASMAFDEYYANARQREVNERHKGLVQQVLAQAQARYAAGSSAQDAVLRTSLELARIEQQHLAIDAARDLLCARINALLHRDALAPLGRPPAALDELSADTSSLASQSQRAQTQRAELRAARARIEGGEAAVERADKAYYPDLGVMGQYSSMWMEPQHRFMLGVSVELPLQIGMRDAASDEAQARLLGSRAELAAKTDEISSEVAQARRRVLQADQQLALYDAQLLPVARARVEAAQAGYAAGQRDIDDVIMSERELRDLELDYEMARAERNGRRAQLLRATGELPDLAAHAGEAP